MKNGVIRWLKPDEEKRLREALMSWMETKSHLGLYQERGFSIASVNSTSRWEPE